MCIAPGSRSTPVVLAVSRDPRFHCLVHLDERCASFFALGIGKASGRPAAVVTTSGTAVAELLPAVVEADESQTPLLLLTADRPRRLRGTDANQTVDQVHIFGNRVREFVDLPEPRASAEALGLLRETADRVVTAALGVPAGPVHVNLPLDKPLEPTPVEGDVPAGWDVGSPEAPLAVRGRPGDEPFTDIQPQDAAPTAEVVGGIGERVSRARRPLLVAGPVPRPGELGPPARALARALDAPLLADPLSGARFGPGARETAVGAYDLYVDALLTEDAERREAYRPDFVLRLGSAPTSQALLDVLGSLPDTPQVVVDPGGRWKDHLGVASEYLRARPGALCSALEERVGAAGVESGWARRWREAGQRAAAALRREGEGEFFEGAAVAAVTAAMPGGGTLFVGSSLPVRDLDAFGLPREEELTVLGNRGASGIDGLVSTALGAAVVGPGPTTAVLGDLSFYHDMNGLFAARRHDLDLSLVVINNDGGGIFHLLPVREFDPPFTEFFATPHGLDFRHAADLYDLPFRRIQDLRELGAEISSPAPAEAGSRIIEIPSDREANRRRRAEVRDAVRRAVVGN